jgi:hypothetical protein
MRYFGSLASLSVNHLIFTENKLPVFSTVDITLIRYPSTGLAGTLTNKKAAQAWIAKTNGLSY